MDTSTLKTNTTTAISSGIDRYVSNKHRLAQIKACRKLLDGLELQLKDLKKYQAKQLLSNVPKIVSDEQIKQLSGDIKRITRCYRDFIKLNSESSKQGSPKPNLEDYNQSSINSCPANQYSEIKDFLKNYSDDSSLLNKKKTRQFYCHHIFPNTQ